MQSIVSSNSEVIPSPTGVKQLISFNSMISTTSAPNCVIVGIKQQPILPVTARNKLQNDTSWSKKPILSHECDLCSKVFTTPSGLRKHSVIHSDSRPFSCEYCDKCFKRSDHLSSHLLAIHKKFKYTYTCSLEECSKEFKDEKTCQDHVAEHQKVLEETKGKKASDLKKPTITVQLPLDVCDKNDSVASSCESDCKDLNDKVVQTQNPDGLLETPKMVVTVSTQSAPDTKQNPINMPSSEKLLNALSNLAAEVKKKASQDNTGGNLAFQVYEDDGLSSLGSPMHQKNIPTTTPDKACLRKSVLSNTSGSDIVKMVTAKSGNIEQTLSNTPPSACIPSALNSTSTTFKVQVPLNRSTLKNMSQFTTSPKKVPILIKLPVEQTTSRQPVNIQRIMSTTKSVIVQNQNWMSVIKPIQPATNNSTRPSLTLLPLQSGASIPKTGNQIQEDKIKKVEVTEDQISSLSTLKGPSKSDLTCHICQRVFQSVRARCGHARIHQSTTEITSAKLDVKTVITNNNSTNSLLNLLEHHPVSATKDPQPVNKVIAGTNVANCMVGTKTEPGLSGSVPPVKVTASPAKEKIGAHTSVVCAKQTTIPRTVYMLPIPIPSQIKPSANTVAPTVTHYGVHSSPYDGKTLLQLNKKSKDLNKDCDTDFLFSFLNPQYFKNNGTKTAEQLRESKESGVKNVHQNNLLCNNYWQPDEIERYQVGMLKFGKDFENIASCVGTRTKTQCEKFYHLLTKLKPCMVDSFNPIKEPWDIPLHQERCVDVVGANWNDLDSLDELTDYYGQCVALKPKRFRTKYLFHKTCTYEELKKLKEEEKEYRRRRRRRKQRQLKSRKSTRIINSRKAGMPQIKLSEKRISSNSKTISVDKESLNHKKSALRTGTSQLNNVKYQNAVVTDIQIDKYNCEQNVHKQVTVANNIKRSKREKRKIFLGEELDSPAKKQMRISSSNDVRDQPIDNSFEELVQIRSSENAA